MTEQENATEEKKNQQSAIFGHDGPRLVDPITELLDNLLGDFSQEEQINKIVGVLTHREYWDESHEKSAMVCLKALEKLFDFQHIVEYRKKLMAIYETLPKEEKEYGHRTYESAIELKLYILKEIIQGWTIYKDNDNFFFVEWQQPQPCFIEDAEECFMFLVKAYKTAHQYFQDQCDTKPYEKLTLGRVRKGIEELFRKHLEKCEWPANMLDKWIILEEVPKAIALVLLKARSRIGGLMTGLEELKFLESIKLFRRSKKAILLAEESLKKISFIEEFAVVIASQVNKLSIVDKVEYDLYSEEQAYLKIIFHQYPDHNTEALKEDQLRYAQTTSNIIEMRNKLLNDTKLNIALEFEGYEFKCKG